MNRPPQKSHGDNEEERTRLALVRAAEEAAVNLLGRNGLQITITQWISCPN